MLLEYFAKKGALKGFGRPPVNPRGSLEVRHPVGCPMSLILKEAL